MSSSVASSSLAPPGGPNTIGGQGWHQLVQWHRAHAEVSFLYSRSLGGFMETGRGRIARLSETAVTIESGSCALVVVLAEATYDLGPQLFFSPNLLHRFDVEGVAVRLPNYDWLFVTMEASPTTLSLRAT